MHGHTNTTGTIKKGWRAPRLEVLVKVRVPVVLHEENAAAGLVRVGWRALGKVHGRASKRLSPNQLAPLGPHRIGEGHDRKVGCQNSCWPTIPTPNSVHRPMDVNRTSTRNYCCLGCLATLENF